MINDQEEFPINTLLKFPTPKPIKRGGLIWLEEIGWGGEEGGAAQLPLKQSFKVGPWKTHISKTHSRSTSYTFWLQSNIICWPQVYKLVLSNDILSKRHHELIKHLSGVDNNWVACNSATLDNPAKEQKSMIFHINQICSLWNSFPHAHAGRNTLNGDLLRIGLVLQTITLTTMTMYHVAMYLKIQIFQIFTNPAVQAWISSFSDEWFGLTPAHLNSFVIKSHDISLQTFIVTNSCW